MCLNQRSSVTFRLSSHCVERRKKTDMCHLINDHVKRRSRGARVRPIDDYVTDYAATNPVVHGGGSSVFVLFASLEMSSRKDRGTNGEARYPAIGIFTTGYFLLTGSTTFGCARFA